MPKNSHFLAFDTSTDVMSVALTDGSRVWQHTGPGGAKASTTLIPAILALLLDAGLTLADLDAIAFGRGPGSFSGLRTACAVAQGLAFGAGEGVGIPVLPIDTLMAVAEEARYLKAQSPHPSPLPGGEGIENITALLDARMDEMYVQHYACTQNVLTPLGSCALIRPEDLVPDAATLYAGNVFTVYTGRLPQGLNNITCLPTAAAMLRLAPVLAASGQCIKAALALPLYVRDKVALTTEERELVKMLKTHTQPDTSQAPVSP